MAGDIAGLCLILFGLGLPFVAISHTSRFHKEMEGRAKKPFREGGGE